MIFSTKGRQPLITSEMRSDLFAYLGGIVRELRGSALIINGTEDHVHMLIRIRPVQTVAEIARNAADPANAIRRSRSFT